MVLSSRQAEKTDNITSFYLFYQHHSHTVTYRRLHSIPSQNLLEIEKQSCTQGWGDISFNSTSLVASPIIICTAQRDVPASLPETAGLGVPPL